MSDIRFLCNPVDVFSIFDLPAWIEAERAAGRIAANGQMTLDVIHPDREMDGSCRWCGGRENESLIVRPDGAIEALRTPPRGR